MKERSFHDRIHTIGRLTVICALVSFMAVPFVLAMVCLLYTSPSPRD